MSGLEIHRLLKSTDLKGKRIGKIWRSEEVFVFELTGGKFLITRPGGFYISSYAPRGKADNFSMFLRKHVSGRIISGVHQYGLDRVIRVDLGGASLVFEVFGKGNIVFIEDERVSGSLHRSDRFRKGEPYAPPESVNFLELSDDEFVELVKGKDKREVARALGIGKLVEKLWGKPLEMLGRLRKMADEPIDVQSVELSFKEQDSTVLHEKMEKTLNSKRIRLKKSIDELKHKIAEYKSKSQQYRLAGSEVMSNLPYYQDLIDNAFQKGEKRIKVTWGDN